MKLMTKAIAKSLPEIGTTDGQGYSAVAKVKYFTPWDSWTWYGTEYEPETERMYGLVVSPIETTLGTFSVAELQSVKGPFFLNIERDLHFQPQTLADCLMRHPA